MKSLILFLSLSTQVYAQDLIATITSDKDSKTYYLEAFYGEDNLVRTLRQTIKIKEKVLNVEDFSLEKINEKKISLLRRGKHPILSLLGEGFDLEYGGNLNIIYLVNAIYKTYTQRTYQVRVNNGKWQLELNGVKIKRFFIKSNRKRFVGVVGIAKMIAYDENDQIIEAISPK